MKVIFLGPPGAGKGTQSELVGKKLKLPHIATGDMLRAAIRKGDTFGKSIEATVAAGGFIADEIIIALVRARIAEPDCANGFILDGFPRTPVQAEALLSAGIKIDFVVQIQVSDDQIIKRLAGRWVHAASGRTYNEYFLPPKVARHDDITGEPLTQRPDDDEATVRKRLAVYHEKTEPLIAWYKDRATRNGLTFITVDGTQGEQKVCDEILTRMRPKKSISSL